MGAVVGLMDEIELVGSTLGLPEGISDGFAVGVLVIETDWAFEDGSVVGLDFVSVVGALLTVDVSVGGSPVGKNDVGSVVGVL